MDQKEFKRQIAEIINWKKDIDRKQEELRQESVRFNERVKKVTGRERLKFDELVLMLCEDSLDQEIVPCWEDLNEVPK